jgi:hypothetical protein
MCGRCHSVRVVAPIGDDSVGPLVEPADLAWVGRAAVEDQKRLGNVVAVPTCQSARQRHPGRLEQQVVLGAGAGAVNRRRLGQASLEERGCGLSLRPRNQSIRPTAFRRRRSSWCSLSHTPARCQSQSRRQALTPEQPVCRGTCRHGIFDLRGWRHTGH